MNYLGLLRVFGPYVAILVLLASCGVEAKRVSNLKGDVTAAVAAQTDPHTKMKWQAEYEVSAANLTTCHSDRDAFKADFDRQTQALAAAKTLTDQRDAAIASARQAAQKSALAAQSAGEALQALRLTGADTCARMSDLAKKVKESIR